MNSVENFIIDTEDMEREDRERREEEEMVKQFNKEKREERERSGRLKKRRRREWRDNKEGKEPKKRRLRGEEEEEDTASGENERKIYDTNSIKQDDLRKGNISNEAEIRGQATQRGNESKDVIERDRIEIKDMGTRVKGTERSLSDTERERVGERREGDEEGQKKYINSFSILM